ncbi:MAG: glycosyltransferase [Hyphomonadaceae bacterium]|nr:glycosyltransferase [Hyphomonadaceae bacterium]
MQIVLADDGLPFDGLTPTERPLGGAESAFVALAEALAAGGDEVTAYAKEARTLEHAGVRWRPHGATLPERADLYIANRSPRLVAARIRTRRRVFWLHNPAQFLSKPRYLWPILRHRPTLVMAGPTHASSAPGWIPAKRAIIPLGIESAFLTTPRNGEIPPPRAVFTSNPMRGLAALLILWREAIRPRVPNAELHIFSGPQVYGATGRNAAAMRAALADAEANAAHGVVIRTPLPKSELARELAAARTLLYLGDPGETFCLAVAEAQAMGVPAVVRPVGSVGERVRHGETGFVEQEPGDFADRAAHLLTDDALWGRFSAQALDRRDALSWPKSAALFRALAR